MVKTKLKLAQIRIPLVSISNGTITIDDSIDQWTEFTNAVSYGTICTIVHVVGLSMVHFYPQGSVAPGGSQITLKSMDGQPASGTGTLYVTYLTSK